MYRRSRLNDKFTLWATFKHARVMNNDNTHLPHAVRRVQWLVVPDRPEKYRRRQQDG